MAERRSGATNAWIILTRFEVIKANFGQEYLTRIGEQAIIIVGRHQSKRFITIETTALDGGSAISILSAY